MKTVARSPNAFKPFGWNAFRHSLPLLDSLLRRRFALFLFFCFAGIFVDNDFRRGAAGHGMVTRCVSEAAADWWLIAYERGSVC